MEDVHVDFLVEGRSSWGWKTMKNGLCSSWRVVARVVFVAVLEYGQWCCEIQKKLRSLWLKTGFRS